MYKSLIKSKELFENSQDVLEDVLQVSIFNKGSLSISVFGIEIEPNSPPFVINASVSHFDFKLEEIVINNLNGKTIKLDNTTQNISANKVLLLFQKVMLPKELKTTHCS